MSYFIRLSHINKCIIFFSALMVCSLGVSFHVGAQSHVVIKLPKPIRSIQLLHVPSDIETVEDISPESIKKIYWDKLVIRDSSMTNRLSSIIEAANLVNLPWPNLPAGFTPIDTRWAIIVTDRYGEKLAIFVDINGRKMIVGHKLYEIHSNLLDAIRKALPCLEN